MKKSRMLNSMILGAAALATICLVMVFTRILKPGGILEQFLYGSTVVIYRLGIVIPLLLALAAAGLVWFLKNRWKYLAAFGTALFGVLLLLFVELLVLPFLLYRFIQGVTGIEFLVKKISFMDICSAAAGVLGIFYWLAVILLVVLTGLCMAGYLFKEDGTIFSAAQKSRQKKEEEKKPEEGTEPGFLGLQGSYAGGTIPLNPGESVIIGRNSELCSLVLEEEGICAQHCCVEFDPLSGQYLVQAFSENGTYTGEGKYLKKEQTERLSRGSILVLGDGKEVFQLL